MSRPASIPIAYFAAVATVLGVMLFFTVKVLGFERSMAQAQASAGLEENVRLALWRMDSAAALLLKTGGTPVAIGNRNAPLQQGQGPERFEQTQQLAISRQEFQQRETIAQNVGADWHAIEPVLLDSIVDLLPGASLAAVGPEARNPDDTRLLASIPARLVVPASALQAVELPWNTPLRISLVVAWACVLMAAGAVGWLLAGTLALSRRRGDFASAVTHELRTPLTTFRMYAEMLSTDMIQDPLARKQYLNTLVSESDRLGHLIENVLAYSRLENRLSQRHAQALTVEQLLEHGLATLRRRVDQAGLAMEVKVSPEASGTTCRTDAVAVQQILLNLIDNACKYGQTAISLAVDVRAQHVEFVVSDRGTGLAPGTRIFTAFGKSKSDPIPGIGLGLYLSRKLARDLGGELEHRAGAQGATFVLRLPV